MPTDLIKKLAKEGKGSIPSLEKKWDKAKDVAEKAGKGNNFGYVTHVFNNMVASSPNVKLEAATLKETFELWKQFHEKTLDKFKELMRLSDFTLKNARDSDNVDNKRAWLNLSNKWASLAVPMKDILREEATHLNSLILSMRQADKAQGTVTAANIELYSIEDFGI